MCSGAGSARLGIDRAQAIDRALLLRPELDLHAHRLRAPAHGAGGGGRGAVVGDVVPAERAADERARAAGQVGGRLERGGAAVGREPQQRLRQIALVHVLAEHLHAVDQRRPA